MRVIVGACVGDEREVQKRAIFLACKINGNTHLSLCRFFLWGWWGWAASASTSAASAASAASATSAATSIAATAIATTAHLSEQKGKLMES